MLRVLTLSTLFPDATRPQFCPFVERQTLALAARPDVEVAVVAPLGIPPLGRFHPRYAALATLASSEDWHGVTVHRPPFAHLPGPGARFDARLLAGALLPRLRALRGRFAFDVIDAQFFWPDGPAAVALGRAIGVPVSIKARGADIHYWGRAKGTVAQVTRAGCEADGLLAVSEALRQDMIALGMPAERIAVHRTGVDRASFHVRDRATAKAALGIAGPLLVGVGALIPRKGHHHAIAALPLLPGVQLALIGKGEAETDLRTLARQCGVADRVRFLGSLPHAAVADWLAAADAMVLMSASEGLANAWIEALASGTPLVISDAGGAREVIDRPEAGRIALADRAAVAARVSEVLAADYARSAVAATVADYSWEANAAALQRHLTALVRPGLPCAG